MRPVLAAAAVFVVAALAFAASAAEDKILFNMKGDVSFVTYPEGESHPLASKASIPLSDDDVARTGARSMAVIMLPDSSRVVMASDTAVKLDAFNAVDASAHFVVANGKLRFLVQHPNGAKANYTFTTPTGQIGVRGTEGDISVDAFDGVRVNVYQAAIPVHVDMINGLKFDIPAGQKIWMRWQDGELVGKVLPLTQVEIDRFSELGPPPTPAP